MTTPSVASPLLGSPPSNYASTPLMNLIEKYVVPAVETLSNSPTFIHTCNGISLALFVYLFTSSALFAVPLFIYFSILALIRGAHRPSATPITSVKPTNIHDPLACYSPNCLKSGPAFAKGCYSPTCPFRVNFPVADSDNLAYYGVANASSATSPSPTQPSTAGIDLSTQTGGHIVKRSLPPNRARRRMSLMSNNMTTGLFGTRVPPTTILCVVTMRELPTDEEIRDLIAKKILKFPRFHSLAVETDTPYGKTVRWVALDPKTLANDLTRFVKRVRRKPGTTLMSAVEPLLNQFWDPNLPLWRLYIVEAPSSSSESAPLSNSSGDGYDNHPALVLELNHAVGDGLSLVRVAMELMTDSKGEAFVIPEYKKEHTNIRRSSITKKPSVVKALQNSAELGVAFVVALWRQVLYALWIADTPSNIKLDHVFYEFNPRRHIVRFKDISLAFVKSVKNAYGCSLNDVMLAALSGAYRKYLIETHDPSLAGFEDSDKDILFRVSIPYSLPRPMNSLELHNKFVIVSCKLPVGINGAPSRRLEKVKSEMNDIKQRPDPIAQVVIQYLAYALFGRTVLSFLSLQVAARMSAACTNVPGPQETGYIGGKEVLAVHPVITTTGCMWAIFSYAGKVMINFNADVRQYTQKDPNRIAELFIEELEAMKAETGVEEDILA
ncbi:hypothetical protein HDV05_003834 [Chytridiales sp. JEL 0842]|nr:hypothetical protein HDV05_003834 [Chytridiales sp. JEL 0842]